MKLKTLRNIILCLLLCAGGFYLKQKDTVPPLTEFCMFCNFKNMPERQEIYVYEDDLVQAFPSIAPANPGHILVIPRRHVQQFEDLTDTEIQRIMSVVKKVHQAMCILLPKPPKYILLQKNGREAFQTVPHVHFHYIPRPEGAFSNTKFWTYDLLIAGLIRSWMSYEELKHEAIRVKEAMDKV